MPGAVAAATAGPLLTAGIVLASVAITAFLANGIYQGIKSRLKGREGQDQNKELQIVQQTKLNKMCNKT